MVVRTSPERPVVHAIVGLDRQVVDAGDPPTHQPVLVEFPILVAVNTKHMTHILVQFVGKAHCDPVVMKGPHLLDQAIIELFVPFACQESFDGVATLQKFRTIAPLTVNAVGERHFGGIARIPRIFGQAYLLRRCLGCERWQRWPGHCLALLVVARRGASTMAAAQLAQPDARRVDAGRRSRADDIPRASSATGASVAATPASRAWPRWPSSPARCRAVSAFAS